MPSRPRALWKNDLALVAAVLIWGLNFPILKAALGAMHPHVLNGFRFLVSALVLGALYVLRRNPGDHLLAPLRNHPWQIVSLGLLGFVFYQFCFIVGIDHTTAGNASIIMASAPIWTALISQRSRFEHLGVASWIGLVMTLAGTIEIVFGGAQRVDFQSATFFGNVMMLAAAVLWGSYTAFSRPVLATTSPTALAFFGLLVSLPFLWALAIPFAGDVDWSGVTPGVWAAIIYSGGLSTGLAVAIWNMAVRAVGPTQTAIFGNLVPFVAVLSSVVLLRETITTPQIIGGLLIVGGVLLARLARPAG
jgi:drug/metabolite transporter (DMT)-like permease